MSTARARTAPSFPGTNEFVSSDFSALASHMHACRRSHGRMHRVHAALETMHALASPRVVTTVALFVACGLALAALA